MYGGIYCELDSNCKGTVMRKALLLAVLLCFGLGYAHAEKVAVWKYHTKEPIDKVYADALQAVSSVKFVVRQENKEQGTINANMNSWSGPEYGALFIVVDKDEDGVFIKATFTRHSGFVINLPPDRWARKFGEELKKEIPDLTYEPIKQ